MGIDNQLFLSGVTCQGSKFYHDNLWLLNLLGCGGCCRTAGGQDGQPGVGRVLTDGTCSGLRRIHLSGLMLKDHLTDR